MQICDTIPSIGIFGGVLLNIDNLSARFRLFADKECRGSSRLYTHLAETIAGDSALLELAAQSRLGQPVPNLFLGAIHYLLLSGIRHPLSDYYPSIVPEPKDLKSIFHCFKDFCNQYEDKIIEILKTKIVQTNEVRRCAYLYPSFCFIYNITQKPLALIEIGTSAGLQLLWDKYSYSYDSSKVYGGKQSYLDIHSEVRGGKAPFLFDVSPPVSRRIGLDLHINNLNDPNDKLWLKALIWPEHKERISYFEKAAAHIHNEPLSLIEGDGILLLPKIASQIEIDSTICVFHTHVANQLSSEAKTMLKHQIEHLGNNREIFHLYNNMWDLDLHLDYYIDGKKHQKTLAKTDGHGRWFQWLL